MTAIHHSPAHPMQDMTALALACRADEICENDCVADFTNGDDRRAIQVFLTHDQIGYGDGWKTVGKEIIGVALVDLDDAAPAEILTRDEAVDLLGYRWADRVEVVE